MAKSQSQKVTKREKIEYMALEGQLFAAKHCRLVEKYYSVPNPEQFFGQYSDSPVFTPVF